MTVLLDDQYLKDVCNLFDSFYLKRKKTNLYHERIEKFLNSNSKTDVRIVRKKRFILHFLYETSLKIKSDNSIFIFKIKECNVLETLGEKDEIYYVCIKDHNTMEYIILGFPTLNQLLEVSSNQNLFIFRKMNFDYYSSPKLNEKLISKKEAESIIGKEIYSKVKKEILDESIKSKKLGLKTLIYDLV